MTNIFFNNCTYILICSIFLYYLYKYVKRYRNEIIRKESFKKDIDRRDAIEKKYAEERIVTAASCTFTNALWNEDEQAARDAGHRYMNLHNLCYSNNEKPPMREKDIEDQIQKEKISKEKIRKA